MKILGQQQWSQVNKLNFFHLICQSPKAPNEMRLVVDRPPRNERNRYRVARRNAALYRAAALLWRSGMNMGRAIAIVDQAMKDAGEV